MRNNLNTINTKIYPKLNLLQSRWMDQKTLAHTYSRYVASKSEALYTIYNDLTNTLAIALSELTDITSIDELIRIMSGGLMSYERTTFRNGLYSMKVAEGIAESRGEEFNPDYNLIAGWFQGNKFLTLDNIKARWYCPFPNPDSGEIGGSTAPFYIMDVVWVSLFSSYGIENEGLSDGTILMNFQVPSSEGLVAPPSWILQLMKEEVVKTESLLCGLEAIMRDGNFADYYSSLSSRIGQLDLSDNTYVNNVYSTLINNSNNISYAIQSLIQPISELSLSDGDAPDFNVGVEYTKYSSSVIGCYWLGKPASLLEANWTTFWKTTRFILRAAWALNKRLKQVCSKVLGYATDKVAWVENFSINDSGEGFFNVPSCNVFNNFNNMHKDITTYRGWGTSISDAISSHFGLNVPVDAAVQAVFGENLDQIIEIPFTFGSILLYCTNDGVGMSAYLKPTQPSIDPNGIHYTPEFISITPGPVLSQIRTLDEQFEILFNKPLANIPLKADDSDSQKYIYESINWSRARMEYVIAMLYAADLDSDEWESYSLDIGTYRFFGYSNNYSGKQIHCGPLSPRSVDGYTINESTEALVNLNFVPDNPTNSQFLFSLNFSGSGQVATSCNPGTVGFNFNQPAFEAIPRLVAFLYYNTKEGMLEAASIDGAIPSMFIPYRPTGGLPTPTWNLLNDSAQVSLYDSRIIGLSAAVATTAIVIFAGATILKAKSAAASNLLLAQSRYGLAPTEKNRAQYLKALRTSNRLDRVFGSSGKVSSGSIIDFTNNASINDVISILK